MVVSHIGQIVNPIHLLLTQRLCGWILHHINPLPIWLYQTLSGKWICIAVLDVKARCIAPFVCLKLPKIRQKLIIMDSLQAFCVINGSVDKCNVLYINSPFKGVSNFHNGSLSHSIGDQIRLSVQKNGTLQPIRPIIVMSQTPQAGLYPSCNHRNILINGSNQVAVNHNRVIGTFSHYASRRIGILLSALFRNRIMVHHRIHIPR